ncbi:endonuclease domain-containing protein [Rufibacter ruber]|uniref:endonuclease domain-containing protein n=1 Tax=Rufibacter ruber TaxID=1783499 RepID=UPI000A7BA3B8|nr:endonuclease domain-containing protein [Rufibacter ruber]
MRDRKLAKSKFRRQHSVGPYIVDFICLEEHLLIEVDGASHHNVGTQMADDERDQWLHGQGYKVLRFTNEEIYQNVERVLWAIEDAFGRNTSEPKSSQ